MVNSADFLSRLCIVKVRAALGGSDLHGGRGVAWWRNGKRQSVAVDTDRNLWFDHGATIGGGILDLVQTALDCDRARAVEWARDFAGVPRHQSTPEERRGYAQRRSEAEPEAARLV